MRADMGRIIDAVKEFVPRARWPELQAGLRREPTPGEITSARVPQAAPVRLVPIGDRDDEQ